MFSFVLELFKFFLQHILSEFYAFLKVIYFTFYGLNFFHCDFEISSNSIK